MWEWKREGKLRFRIESPESRRVEENDEANERDLSRRCYSQSAEKSVSFPNSATFRCACFNRLFNPEAHLRSSAPERFRTCITRACVYVCVSRRKIERKIYYLKSRTWLSSLRLFSSLLESLRPSSLLMHYDMAYILSTRFSRVK